MAQGAAAQMPGVPVDFAPASMGVSITALFGRGINENSGKANSLGAEITYGGQQFFVGGQVGLFDLGSEDDGHASQINFGGKAGFMLPLQDMPVSVAVVAGGNYWSDGDADVKSLFVPAGVTVGFNVPSESVAITPWVSPQFRYNRVTVMDVSGSNSDFGVSGGLKIDFQMFGIDLLVDYDNAGEAFTAGGGVHVAFPTGG
jgi:hypothetical protein